MVRYLASVAVTRVIIPYNVATSLDHSSRTISSTPTGRDLRKVGLPPSPPCDDAEFFRRIHLSTLATLPRPEDVRAFLADKSADKREKAIDAVLRAARIRRAWATSGATCS